MIRKKKKYIFRPLKALIMLFSWLFLIGAIVLLSYFIYLQRTLPDAESIATRKVGESTKIFDRTGSTLLYDIHGEEKRTIIPWDNIPDYVKKATLASEDNNFYEHRGLDLKGITRAFLKNIKSGKISQGGSTITQQLVKNALLSQERTLTRKLKELILAIEIERRFTKEEIFWMYLNQIPYGSNAYGIEAASKTFFNKNSSELSLAESVVLASLPKAPTYYSPYGSNINSLMARKNRTLSNMLELRYIEKDAFDNAVLEEVEFRPGIVELNAPHFVIMVREYLVSKYGEEAVENGGFRITTTLDSELQEQAEEIIAKYAESNLERFNASNAALVAIDPKTGYILALVGSNNYFDIENEGNFNVATAKRQPGSAFKPFAYATAFKNGYSDSTVVFDLETEFNPECDPDVSKKEEKDKYGLDCYNPKNYDDRFRGPVTLRQSLAQSLNIPSVKTLYLAGVENTINLAESMGISTLEDRSRFGLSLVLGGAEVKLVDLVSAYGVFANDGVRNPWLFIEKIELSNGTVLEENTLNPSRVLDSQTSRLINDVLSDNRARAPVFGYSSYLYIPGMDIAAKTGTTQENRDAWLVGYTPSFVVGVWTGNNTNESMTDKAAGVSVAGPIWKDFINSISKIIPAETFSKPNPVFSNKTMMNGQYLYRETETSNPEFHNILYYIDKNNPNGPFPNNPNNDSQFENWEWIVGKTYGATT